MREMKDSGIEWVGTIPQDWQLSKIGNLYTQRNEKVSDKDYQPLSVTMQGILPQLATAAKTDDGDNRKLVRVGDFAINSRSDRRGSCGISPLDGSVSPNQYHFDTENGYASRLLQLAFPHHIVCG